MKSLPALLWQSLWAPSLSRRLVLSLLLAFTLCGLVLGLNEYRLFKQQMAREPGVQRVGRVLADSLAVHGTAVEQRAILAAAATQYNALRAHNQPPLPPLLLQLRAADGDLLFAAPAGADALAGGPHDEVVDSRLGEQAYWLYTHRTSAWTFTLAEPALADITVLQWIAVELLPDLALAFPFVLIPLWLSVRGGLRPLRVLARRLRMRTADDFSPLDEPLRYAELDPLIRAFDALLTRLRERLARERAFVQDAAHELRTPMAVISAQAHALVHARDGTDRQQAEQALDHAIARASHLTRQLLALAALDHENDEHAAMLDLSDLLQTLLAQSAPEALARDMELELDVPPQLPCRGDLHALQSIVLNLLDNAIRYGRTQGHILVSARREGALIYLQVADDGPGIPMAEREQVFERFRRGSDPGVTGTGLGLAIVRKAAQRLGGTVTLGDGLDGHGAGFRLRFPG